LREGLTAFDGLPEFSGDLRYYSSDQRRYVHLFVGVRLNRAWDTDLSADRSLDYFAQLEMQAVEISGGDCYAGFHRWIGWRWRR
jgi:hypothetical protein